MFLINFISVLGENIIHSLLFLFAFFLKVLWDPIKQLFRDIIVLKRWSIGKRFEN